MKSTCNRARAWAKIGQWLLVCLLACGPGLAEAKAPKAPAASVIPDLDLARWVKTEPLQARAFFREPQLRRLLKLFLKEKYTKVFDVWSNSCCPDTRSCWRTRAC